MALQIGKMRHQISIQQQATQQDASGERVTTWSQFALVRAEIEQTPGREVWASAQRNERVPTVFHIRYLTGFTSDMRVVWGTKEFNVLSIVDPGGMHAELVITAEQVTK